MENISNYNYFDELDDLDQIDILIGSSQRKRSFPAKNPGRLLPSDREFLKSQDDSTSGFNFSYKAARFEEWWLLDSLGDFYEHQWISDVLKRVKGGKEASVYLCLSGSEVPSELIAAKVYRPRSLRNLKNDHLYRAGRSDLDNEGKLILDDGKLHAMKKKTEYGKELLHQSWIAYEFTSLERLHAAGADVPQPFTMAHNAILMSFIGDRDGSAPALNEITLEKQEAVKLFDGVLKNIEIMLSCGMIHGDLSAYNILYWEGALSLIDFPQVISPNRNKSGFAIFQRDIVRVCDYFSKQGINSNGKKIALEMWTSHGYPVNQEVDVRLLDTDDPRDIFPGRIAK